MQRLALSRFRVSGADLRASVWPALGDQVDGIDDA